MAKKPRKQPPEPTGPSQLEVLEKANKALRTENARLTQRNEELFRRYTDLQRVKEQRSFAGVDVEDDDE